MTARALWFCRNGRCTSQSGRRRIASHCLAQHNRLIHLRHKRQMPSIHTHTHTHTHTPLFLPWNVRRKSRRRSKNKDGTTVGRACSSSVVLSWRFVPWMVVRRNNSAVVGIVYLFKNCSARLRNDMGGGAVSSRPARSSNSAVVGIVYIIKTSFARFRNCAEGVAWMREDAVGT